MSRATRLFVVAVVAVAPAIALAACSSAAPGNGATATPSSDPAATTVTATVTRTPSPRPPDVLAGQLPFCGDCRITGQVQFTHPTWGPSTLVTTLDSGEQNEPVNGHIAVVDAAGRIRWDRRVARWYELAPHQGRAIDGSRHILLDYNPGRYNGVIVLSPTPAGFEDFRTLPAFGEYNARFYYAEFTDVDNDGTYEIKQSANDCDPDCAGGSVTNVVYRWNGSDYVRS